MILIWRVRRRMDTCSGSVEARFCIVERSDCSKAKKQKAMRLRKTSGGSKNGRENGGNERWRRGERKREDTVGSESVVTVVGKRPTSSKERVLSMSRGRRWTANERRGEEEEGEGGERRSRGKGRNKRQKAGEGGDGARKGKRARERGVRR